LPSIGFDGAPRNLAIRSFLSFSTQSPGGLNRSTQHGGKLAINNDDGLPVIRTPWIILGFGAGADPGRNYENS
jgi:hypothetical protein